MCGKNTVDYLCYWCLQGSPPRVREEPDESRRPLNEERITPACAGRTWRWKLKNGVEEDHPRVCGKNQIILKIETGRLGSPPRVREERRLVILLSVENGITPACAGRTFHEPRPRCSYQDHPRVCGKNFTQLTSLDKGLGSPPRVREEPQNLVQV